MERFWFNHVVFINEKGKQELRGRYFYALAAIIYFGGNYWALNVLPQLLK